MSSDTLQNTILVRRVSMKKKLISVYPIAKKSRFTRAREDSFRLFLAPTTVLGVFIYDFLRIGQYATGQK